MTLALRNIFRALFVDDPTPSIFSVLIPSRSEKSHSNKTSQSGSTATSAANFDDAASTDRNLRKAMLASREKANNSQARPRHSQKCLACLKAFQA